jgi:chaperonin GroEL
VSTLISFDSDARAALQRGFDTVANLVRVTHGPAGRLVVVGRGRGTPIATGDASAIARAVEITDLRENVGAALAREVVVRADERAGLGGSTALMLAQTILSVGLRSVTAGANPVGVRRGIERATTAVCEELRRRSTEVARSSDIEALATSLSGGDQQVGRMLAEAFETIGPLGVVTVEESAQFGMRLHLDRGISLDRGYLSPDMVLDQERSETVLDDPYVLAYDGTISTNAQLIPLLEQVVAAHAPLFIAAVNIDGEALATITMNMRRKMFKVVAVKANWFVDHRQGVLRDIAVFTGGSVIGNEGGLTLEHATLADLGRARRASADRRSSLIVDGAGAADAIAQRIRQLETEQDAAGSILERDRVTARIAKLSGGVGVISIGARHEIELKKQVRHLEQTIAATRAAISDGVVPGGGSAYVLAAEILDSLDGDDDELVGIAAVKAALDSPLSWLASNAGHDGPSIVSAVRDAPWGHGFDLRRGAVVDLIDQAVLYPTEVACAALETAASVISLMLTTEAILAERPDAGALPDEIGWHGRDKIAGPAPRERPAPPPHWRRPTSPGRPANTVIAPTGPRP